MLYLSRGEGEEMADTTDMESGGRAGLHETSTPVQLYKRESNPLPYRRAAAKAFLLARLDPLQPEPPDRGTRVPEDRRRRPVRSSGLEEERDTKCRSQRVP